MGIDRKDVRIVCHLNIPKSMEAFYQESGRAGRDQLPSRSVLYYGMDDRKRMEFILSNAERKKAQPSNLRDGSVKKSLDDFNQMVEYCEGSACRRKKILESFGEQVPASLCRKSCDACKHPNLVAKYLEELTTTTAFCHKNGSSRIYISSSSNLNDEEQFSEFWNRDDEASGSEEDISDSDDGIDVVKSLAQSKLPSKSRVNEKIELLQRAEENYYRKKIPGKENNKLDKNAISETLREASKQRLLNALKQTQQQLSNLQIDFETSAVFLENECYKKYGKTGKSFYYSQVASTVRWLSTVNSTELTNRLGTNTNSTSDNITSKTLSSSTSSSLLDQGLTETINEEIYGSVRSETPVDALLSASQDVRLPTIPSFSEFVNSREVKKQSAEGVPKNLEKRMRLQ
ncbi:hypothetical protein F0562_009763 [Nyssa sinensis]|uniref:DNA 3'-5' helicase n=1 Tax=Nyssa sinensis TaxID=561372 RepID=A0A5J4ZYH8_9ASTE|nr:hypothetical protein F0562_009763 [Nyssa sinensis]